MADCRVKGKKSGRKRGLPCLALAALALCLLFPGKAAASAMQGTENRQVVEAELVRLETQQDLTVMFTYEGDKPQITLLSPSGKEYAEGISGETELLAAHGEGWSTYKILAAEPGTWRVRCDKKNNEYVDYSLVDEVDGLCIRSFEVLGIGDGQAKLSFDVGMGEEEQIRYHYRITVIAGEDTSAGKQVAEGNAYTQTPMEVTVSLALSDYENYRFLLETTAVDGLEMYDSMLSEPFAYVNPGTPDRMEDFSVMLDAHAGSCRVNWEEFAKGYSTEYYLVAVADGDTDNPIYTENTRSRETVFYYPAGTEKLTVELYYRWNDILSAAVTKEMNLQEELLGLVTEEQTAAAQLELTYRTAERTSLEVTVNGQSGTYFIEDAGTIYFPLQEGTNRIEASFQGRNRVTYCISGTVYRDNMPPVLTLFEDYDGMTFRQGSAVIAGSVKNAARLLINDTEVALGEDGTFSHAVTLGEGANCVTIVAESPSGIGNSRTMQLLYEKGGAVTGTETGWKSLLIALGVSAVIILYTLIFVRRSEKPRKERRGGVLRSLLTAFLVLAGALDAAAIAAYVFLYRFNNSRQYVELVRESLEKAARYLDYQELAMMAVLALSGVLLLSLLAFLLVRHFAKKRKKTAEPNAVLTNGEEKQ